MKKKMVSLLLAGALFASMPLTVCAATPVTAPGSADITTEGDVNYVDTTVYSVTLPTAGCFNFVVDPQGILSATDSTNYPEEKYPAGTAGYIVATEGTGAYINNLSSVPIKLLVDAYIVSDDTTTGTPSSVKLMSLEEYGAGFINSGIDNNMLLAFDVTNDSLDVTTFADATSIKTETVNPYVIAITQNGKPDAAQNQKATQLSFALNKAAYEFASDGAGGYLYNMKAGETGDSVGLRLSGFVNTNADWSAYTGASGEKIVVSTVFSFDKLSSDYELSALDGRAHGVLADTDPAYFAGPEYDADGALTGNPAPGAMDYVVGQGALEIPFSFGTGTKEVTVTTVNVGGADIAATDYKVNNGVISLKSTETNVAAAMDSATPEGTPVPVIITTSDTLATNITVTMYAVE